jgi:multidrug efflux pump subunit AcrA (membrane-fusion protein)
VQVGQRVQKDDVLFIFDQTVNQQELKRLNEQLRSLRAEKARLESERDGYKNDPEFPVQRNVDEERQLHLYKSRKA